MNHSCSPNLYVTMIRGQNDSGAHLSLFGIPGFFAERLIARGSELTFDYGWNNGSHQRSLGKRKRAMEGHEIALEDEVPCIGQDKFLGTDRKHKKSLKYCCCESSNCRGLLPSMHDMLTRS